MTEHQYSLHIADIEWRLADPFEVQDPVSNPVPAIAGLYLWLERTTPGPTGRATNRVLYVGQSTNLRDRLHRYSAIAYTREDPVLRSLFDRVIAPQLDCDTLRDTVVSRQSSCLAQMWIRDHVVFGWIDWDGAGRRAKENRLRALLGPVFNSDPSWTRYEPVSHADHDLIARIGARTPN